MDWGGMSLWAPYIPNLDKINPEILFQFQYLIYGFRMDKEVDQ